ncbi:hypothetical protein [Streptomyces fuscigenes]|uniref:hypothetical protein n=1 Tax=Streptomyces fuscigenes TaxID=1528880 RepID=UPI001F1A4B41|nr:hypothetical protein [Streptomyces fuscigenes]MCF3960443.1 hypothetical protein [Streptomyces fuscigenes]
MDESPMPEPLRHMIHQLVAEAVLKCEEVLRYTQPDLVHDWERMTLYRATDAADSLDKASLLIAAYCQRDGMSQDRINWYLQTDQQRSRAAGPGSSEQQLLAGLLGEPAPSEADDENGMDYSWGQRTAEQARTPESDPMLLLTQACLHGLSTRLSDDVDALDTYLPTQTATTARNVAAALHAPQPAAG